MTDIHLFARMFTHKQKSQKRTHTSAHTHTHSELNPTHGITICAVQTAVFLCVLCLGKLHRVLSKYAGQALSGPTSDNTHTHTHTHSTAPARPATPTGFWGLSTKRLLCSVCVCVCVCVCSCFQTWPAGRNWIIGYWLYPQFAFHTCRTRREVLCTDVFTTATNPPHYSDERWSTKWCIYSAVDITWFSLQDTETGVGSYHH